MASSKSVPHTRIVIGLVLGAVIGSLVNYLSTDPAAAAVIGQPPPPRPAWVEATVKYVTKPIGDIFLNLLFMAIIPLVFSSLVVGVTRLGGMGNVGRIGMKTLAYFLITTLFAAVIGLVMVNVIRPGDQLSKQQQEELMNHYSQEDKDKVTKKAEFGINTFVNIVPRNPLMAFVERDMLAVIFTAILVGIALTQMTHERSQPIIVILEGVNQITHFIINLAMSIAPYAVFALLFSTTALFGYKLLIALGAFVLTVLSGLFVHQFVVLPLLVYTLGGMSPLEFFRKTKGTMITAFSTSSSSATLPAAIRCAEEDLNISKPVANFILPLGASMNHNGTALFEGVTVMFLAQVFGVDLSIDQQIIVLLLCILTATGMAGVPGGSLPLIGMVLAVVGVEPGALAIILGVDRILDMCRTVVNVSADLTTVLFIQRTERKREALFNSSEGGAA